MGFLGKIGAALMKFDKGGKSSPMAKGYAEAIGANKQNADWIMDFKSDDANSWQYRWLVSSRMRDLADTNPYVIKYVDELWANTYGEQGIMLRSKVQETEDRVIHTPDEKSAHLLHQRKREELFEWLSEKSSAGIDRELEKVQERIRELRDNREATVKVGDLDIFANKLIETAWKEWQRAEFADIRGLRNYNTLRQLRLRDCVTDGGVFIVPIKDRKVNKFGFTLRHINDQWCDSLYNETLPNGNEVRMGIEWERTRWGLGKPVAFYFIKRQDKDWLRGQMRGVGYSGLSNIQRDRVPAEEVIYFTRYKSNDSTRPMPWGAGSIQTARQLTEYEIAEVIAARVACCSTGYIESDLDPEGGFIGSPDPNDPMREVMQLSPGGVFALPHGKHFKGFDPTHPNGNYAEFRKGQIRSLCAGLIGANYNIIANDAEGISYSTGRIFSLDDRELWKLLQRFDIDTAERPIFEQWLEMALITGAIPLPLAKYAKFNKPLFSGRRWSWIDPKSDAISVRERLLLGLTSRSRECDESGIDFEDILFELAQEERLIKTFKLDAISLSTIANPATEQQPKGGASEDVSVEESGEDEPEPKKVDGGKSGEDAGLSSRILNGSKGHPKCAGTS